MRTLNRVKIGGKYYPLSFSLFAAQLIAEKYGTVENAIKMMNEAHRNKKQADAFGILSDLTESLMKSGCEYYNEFGRTPQNDDPVDENGNFVPLTARQILLMCGVSRMQHLSDAVRVTLEEDQKKKIHTQPKRDVKKNRSRK